MADAVPGGVLLCFFFKQKTAYELRISDWSSDVCSSDLGATPPAPPSSSSSCSPPSAPSSCACSIAGRDRKSVVSGKSVSVRVDLGGRRIIKKKIYTYTISTQHTSILTEPYHRNLKQRSETHTCTKQKHKKLD